MSTLVRGPLWPISTNLVRESSEYDLIGTSKHRPLKPSRNAGQNLCQLDAGLQSLITSHTRKHNSILKHTLFSLLFTDMTLSPVDHTHHFERVIKLREIPDHNRLLKNQPYVNHAHSFEPGLKLDYVLLRDRFVMCQPHLIAEQVAMIRGTFGSLWSAHQAFLNSYAALDTLRFYSQLLNALFQQLPDGRPYHDGAFLAHPALNDMFFWIDLKANMPHGGYNALHKLSQDMITEAQLACNTASLQILELKLSREFHDFRHILNTTYHKVLSQNQKLLQRRIASGKIDQCVREHALARRASCMHHSNPTKKPAKKYAKLAKANLTNIHQTGMMGRIKLSNAIVDALAEVQEAYKCEIVNGLEEQEKCEEEDIANAALKRRQHEAGRQGLYGVEKRMFLAVSEAEDEVRKPAEEKKVCCIMDLDLTRDNDSKDGMLAGVILKKGYAARGFESNSEHEGASA